MNDIPKVFINPINEEINNYQERTIVNNDNQLDLNNILTSDKYSFNHKYLITLNNNKEITSSIIQITSNKLLTIDGDWIRISDIKSIIEIKK